MRTPLGTRRLGALALLVLHVAPAALLIARMTGH